MKTLEQARKLFCVAVLVVGPLAVARAQSEASNVPPKVSILWPSPTDPPIFHVFDGFAFLKIKADAADPDGSIAQVQFFAGSDLIGVVANPPFNLVWQIDRGGNFQLKAVAVDNLGAKSESVPVSVWSEQWPGAAAKITYPPDRALFAAPAAFTFSAELLAMTEINGALEFFVGTNSVGVVDQARPTATTPPASVVVTNLAEGEYGLRVRYRGTTDCWTCDRLTNTIRVVKLGVRLPKLTPEGHLQFEVVTSFPGKPTIIQASPNLRDWEQVSTNVPPGNTFSFTDPFPGNNSPRFHRALVPPE